MMTSQGEKMETVFDVVKRIIFITYELGRFILAVIGGMLFGAFSRDGEEYSSVVGSDFGDHHTDFSEDTVRNRDGSIEVIDTGEILYRPNK
jgi:hypothetical protein